MHGVQNNLKNLLSGIQAPLPTPKYDSECGVDDTNILDHWMKKKTKHFRHPDLDCRYVPKGIVGSTNKSISPIRNVTYSNGIQNGSFDFNYPLVQTTLDYHMLLLFIVNKIKN